MKGNDTYIMKLAEMFGFEIDENMSSAGVNRQERRPQGFAGSLGLEERSIF